MRSMVTVLLASIVSLHAHATTVLPGGVQLLCHRTANEDVPKILWNPSIRPHCWDAM